MTSAVILSDRGILAVGGSDRRSFLQGLVSNDVDQVSPEKSIYAALLTPQGKFLFEFFIVELGETLLLDTEKARLADLMKRLTMYKLRADVTLQDASDDWTVVALLDEGESEPGTTESWGHGLAFLDPRTAKLGKRAILSTKNVRQDIEKMGYSPSLHPEYEERRIALGVPDHHDLVVDKTLLLEANFDDLNAISFKKGCYVGQEMTARTKYRGNVRRRMYPVRIDGPPPAPDAEILLGEKVAGEMRSVADGRGIALLRIEDVENSKTEGTPLTSSKAMVFVEDLDP